MSQRLLQRVVGLERCIRPGIRRDVLTHRAMALLPPDVVVRIVTAMLNGGHRTLGSALQELSKDDMAAITQAYARAWADLERRAERPKPAKTGHRGNVHHWAR